MQDLFEGIIGQKKAKKKLTFYYNSFKQCQIFPNCLLVAEKGNGKTTLARRLAKHLHVNKDEKTPRNFLEVNCSTVRNVKHFFEQVVEMHQIHELESTLLLDECSELPKDVQMALLTVLNPGTKVNHFTLGDGRQFTFDFRRVSFLFATTEIQKMFHALLDRITRVDLEPYSGSELWSIAKLKLDQHGIRVSKNIVADVTSRMRGNGRDATKLGEDIIRHCQNEGITELKAKDWRKFKNIMSVNPFGMNESEMKVLAILFERGAMKVTHMATVFGMTRAAMQSIETFLLRHGLIRIDSQSTRNITPAGMKAVSTTQTK